MNERLRELKKQSTNPNWDGDDGPANEFNPDKFAELIVAECLEACSRANEIRHFVPPTQKQVVYTCMREIKETFRS
jgi:hypothetical protein